VKVDRCLIDAIETDRLQQVMLLGVVHLQNSAGMRVVIEGVERLEQRQTLLNLGCRLGQGFLFSKPIQAEQLDQLLKAAGRICSRPPEQGRANPPQRGTDRLRIMLPRRATAADCGHPHR